MNKQKNSGGKHMSLTKSTTRRLPLLAGSSLAAAGLTTALAFGMAMAPGSASAQACTPTGTTGPTPASNGSAPDTYVCPVATYPTGIQHTSNGDLDVTALAASNFGTGGVVSTAGPTSTNTDDIILRLGGTVSSSTTTYTTAFPVLLDAQSQQGDVLVDVAVTRATSNSATLTASNAATTHFVKAISHAGGDVAVTRSAGTGAMGVTGAGGIAGVEARSFGGGDVTITSSSDFRGGQYGVLASVDGVGDLMVRSGGEAVGANGIAAIHATSTGSGDILIDNSGSSGGRLYGIVAHATGSGDVTIAHGGSTDSIAGIAGIWARTGTGLLTITGFGGSSVPGTGVLIDAAGDVNFTGRATGGQYGLYITNVHAGTTTTLNLGETSGGVAAVRASGAGELIVNVTSETEDINYDFSGMANPVDVNFSGAGMWTPTNGASAGPSGDVRLVFAEDGVAIVGSQSLSSATEPATVVTFPDPDVVIDNRGYLLVGPRPVSGSSEPDQFEGELRLVGLGEFRHSGLILLGARGQFGGGAGAYVPGTLYRQDFADGWYDDILSMPGVDWIGEGGTILFDVDISRSQTDCTRDPDTGDLGAADCVKLVGGTTEGVTYIKIFEAFPGDQLRPTEEGILLVDVAGGSSAAGHFVLDPGTAGYTPLFGGSLDRGLYHYVLAYNEDTQQHTLFGFTGAGGDQLAQYTTAAHGLWRVSAASWLDRQADLRGGIEPGVGGGVWLRASGEKADRDVMTDTVRGGQTFTFDNTYQQTSYAVTGGLDLISAGADDTAWVVGLMAGYNYADVEYEAWANTGQLDGFNAGAYASFISGGMYVDAALNANRLILKNDMPGLNIFPEGSILDTIVVSVGGQVEAGWRLPIAGSMFVEPLASISYVRSKYDDLEVASADPSRPGINVVFDDPASLRASVGGRAGVDQDFGFLRTQFSVLGRVWNEFDGENTILVENEFFPDEAAAAVVDDFSGQFTELGLGASVWSPGGLVSGFLNVGGKFGDDYQAKTGTVGVRVAW